MQPWLHLLFYYMVHAPRIYIFSIIGYFYYLRHTKVNRKKMEQENIKSLSERAMFYGTIFGAVMITTNIFYLQGLSSQIFSTLFLIFILSSPVIAGRLAANCRKKEMEDKMSFTQAWQFLLIMYVCAAILTAIAQFVYFTFLDNGYFLSTILQQFDTLIDIPEIDETLRGELTKTADLMRSLSNRDIIMQIFGTNIIISPIITFFIAIFVKKKGNQ